MEIKPEITIEDFGKIDIRLGTITNVEQLPDSEKLLKLTVDFDTFIKTIFSGIKKDFPDTSVLLNKKAAFVVNLPPRKMMGQLSEGMILGVEDTSTGKYTILTTLDPVESTGGFIG